MYSDAKHDTGKETDAYIRQALLDVGTVAGSVGASVRRDPEKECERSQVQIKCEFRSERRVLTMPYPVKYEELRKKVYALYSIGHRSDHNELAMFMTLTNNEILTAINSQKELEWAVDFTRSCPGSGPRPRSLRILLTECDAPADAPRKRRSQPAVPICIPSGLDSRAYSHHGHKARTRSEERGSPPPGSLPPDELAAMGRSPSMTTSMHMVLRIRPQSEGEFIPEGNFSPGHSADSSYSGSRSSLYTNDPNASGVPPAGGSALWTSRFPTTRLGGSGPFVSGTGGPEDAAMTPKVIGGSFPKRMQPGASAVTDGSAGGPPVMRQTFPRVRHAMLSTGGSVYTGSVTSRGELSNHLSASPAPPSLIASRRSQSSSTSSGITSSMDSPAALTSGGGGGAASAGDSANRYRSPLTPLNWQRGRLLGRGAFGQVHLCKDTETGREFALKEVLFGDNGSTGEVSRQTAALENEIRLFRSLSHPALVQYYGASRSDNGLCIFMEYMPGGSVKDEIKQYGPLTEGLTRRYTRQILKGLIFLHQATVIHRDIKAANILRDSAGSVKLADFGAARQLQTICTFSGAKSFCGTPFWMAPEVIRGEVYNSAADIWSLACTVVEMISRNPPYHELEPMAALFRIATVGHPEYSLPTGASAALTDFLDAAFRPQAKSRPSAEQLLEHRFCANGQ